MISNVTEAELPKLKEKLQEAFTRDQLRQPSTNLKELSNFFKIQTTFLDALLKLGFAIDKKAVKLKIGETEYVISEKVTTKDAK